MTPTTRFAALMVAACLSGTVLYAGPDPASPTPIVPPPPPVSAPAAPGPASPQTIQAAQSLATALSSNPPQSMSPALKARVVDALNGVLLQPELAAQLGLSVSQLETLLQQVQAIPTS